ncbi:MAG: hypothetical protein WCP06_04975 [Verrucomicrobiota bacterium]
MTRFSSIACCRARGSGVSRFGTKGLFTVLTLLWAASAAVAAQDDPPKHIDVGSLPAKVVDEVVVPVPTEVFGVLDKLGSPNWHEVLRPVKIDRMGRRPQVALLLGTVIAEGFIAVEAQESEEVKKIGKQVLVLARAIGVEKSVLTRTSSIIDAADKKDWQRIRVELDGASQDVKTAMIELNDEQLAQLVSLGGWLRGTEALTQVVLKSYSKDGAELLHQPALLEYFQKRLDSEGDRLKRNAVVKKIRGRLPELQPLIEQPNGISEQKVNEIHSITRELVAAISAQES